MWSRATTLSISLLALLLEATTACAQTQNSLEACTQWRVENGKLGFWNKCGQPVVVNFMQLNTKRPTVRTIASGARFDTGRTPATLKRTGWMSTRCAVGYSPDVSFIPHNKDKIIASQYQCVKK